MLARQSQHSNTKLSKVARDLLASVRISRDAAGSST